MILLDEGMGRVGRMVPPGGCGRWWVGDWRGHRWGVSSQPHLHVVPVVGEDEPFQHFWWWSRGGWGWCRREGAKRVRAKSKG